MLYLPNLFLFYFLSNEENIVHCTAVLCTWRVEAEDALDIGDVDNADGVYTRGGRLALDARMIDDRAAQILVAC